MGKPVRVTTKRFGRTFNLREWLMAILHLIPRMNRAWAVWGRHRMDPAFREQIMLTVARSNGCPYCSYHHQEWAIQAGASDEEIAELEGTDRVNFDRAKWSAFVYARALAENDFGGVPAEIRSDVAKYHSPDELCDIETVARAMSFANRSANTADALFFRRHGIQASDSLLAEIVIALNILMLSPVIVYALCRTLRKSPPQFLREIRDIHRRHAADLGLTAATTKREVHHV